jgi:hypothetical protein
MIKAMPFGGRTGITFVTADHNEVHPPVLSVDRP